MRYIIDSNGCIKELSFGATITCGETDCTEYTGSIPTGYESLESWYLVEYETLYRWKIVDGNLTLDETAVAPVEKVIVRMNNEEEPYFVAMRTDTTGLNHIEPYYNSNGDSGFIVYNDGVAYILAMASTGLHLRYYDQSSGQFIDYSMDGSSSGGGTGEAGVGILSVEQTTTSTEDGGNNVITVTLTDGTKSTFTVKNGSAGKTAYQYAVDGGYTGTEAEFAAKMAAETFGVHIGPDAPADENTTLWVDTDETPEPESGSGGVSSWNDLTDRPFYSEYETGTVLAETSPAFIEDVGSFFLTDPIRVTTGEEYTVKWNGTNYTCVCGEFELDGVIAQYLGNTSVMGGEDTGEPFLVLVLPSEVAAEDGITAEIIPLDGSTELTISITGMMEIVHQIPVKYLSHRSIDVHFSVSANPDMSIVVTADMDASDVIRYAKTPNTTIRAVRINKGIDDVLVLGLVSANSEVAVFRCITGIENSSIVGQAPEGVALATTFSKCLFAELYAYSDGTYSYEQISA